VAGDVKYYYYQRLCDRAQRKQIMDFDFRLLIVLFPLIGAAVWAGINILPVALKQIQGFLSKEG
jgi:photosystem II PsbY protein